jgi:hypothetical protein
VAADMPVAVGRWGEHLHVLPLALQHGDQQEDRVGDPEEVRWDGVATCGGWRGASCLANSSYSV